MPFDTFTFVVDGDKLKKNVFFKNRIFKFMLVAFSIRSMFESELQRLLKQIPNKSV